MVDSPLHLAELSICKRVEGTESSVVVPVWLTQSGLDGLYALLVASDGFSRSGQGQLPGVFAATMLYRSLANGVMQAERDARHKSK